MVTSIFLFLGGGPKNNYSYQHTKSCHPHMKKEQKLEHPHGIVCHNIKKSATRNDKEALVNVQNSLKKRGLISSSISTIEKETD